MKYPFQNIFSDSLVQKSYVNFRYQQTENGKSSGEQPARAPQEGQKSSNHVASENDNAANNLALALPRTTSPNEKGQNTETSTPTESASTTEKTSERPTWTPKKSEPVILPNGQVVRTETTNTELGVMAYKDSHGEIQIGKIPEKNAGSISEGLHSEYIGNRSNPEIIERGQKTSTELRTALEGMATQSIGGTHGEALQQKLADMPSAMTQQEAIQYKRDAFWDVSKGIVDSTRNFDQYTPSEKARAEQYQNILADQQYPSIDEAVKDIREREKQADHQEAVQSAIQERVTKLPETAQQDTKLSYQQGFEALDTAQGEAKNNIQRALAAEVGQSIKFSDGRIGEVTGHKDGNLLLQIGDPITGGTSEQKISYANFRGAQLADGTELSGIYEKTFGGSLDTSSGSTSTTVKPSDNTVTKTPQNMVSSPPSGTRNDSSASQINAPTVPIRSIHEGVPDNAPPHELTENEQLKQGSNFSPKIPTREEGKYTVADDTSTGYKIAKYDDYIKVGSDLAMDEYKNMKLGEDSVEFRMKYQSDEVEEISYRDARGEYQYIPIQDGIIPEKFKKYFEVLKRMGIIKS